VVLNPAHAEGQSTSLARGLGAVTSAAEAAVVLVGDQPGVTSALIDRVVGAFLAGEAAAVRPVWRDAAGGVTPGHPVVLARRLWPEAARLDGDQGARALFATHPEWLREIEIVGEPPCDVDGLEDYGRVVAAVGTPLIGG
jgi:CTP:molybdopterin cytidylyltransferase MocA